MTLNFQYYSSYPADTEAAEARLRETLGGPQAPDVICVQEGVYGEDVLASVGFDLCVDSAQHGLAQSVSRMVYSDSAALKACAEDVHEKLLCNQVYRRRTSLWEMADSGAMRISSEIMLEGGETRIKGELAIRSMVWVKLQNPSSSAPAVYVMCSHISGGRFEDQYFVQQLAQERFQQVERIASFFLSERPEPRDPNDVGIVVGDFNACREYVSGGPMAGYFKSSIATSVGVQSDAADAGLGDKELEERFQEYMVSPFAALSKVGWAFAYDSDTVGATSGFGHLIDHMSMSRPLKVQTTELVYYTNQKFGKKADTDLVLTDHNAVKSVFVL